ncbi:NlpC/P60 family protein [Amphritea sp. 1_MG-2023]|uniref:NlpC/P60 family protein n=1 Tax=Amphritea sp. 1_MG-2023 TaxID=3062670 RepID=UPI0026E40096|nr:NlpC/P60 family protein [Amphritea sp. 1_MG-2023]MDO6564594.1 NlpC/P60 family protein [Amphritea sp. 1_MG-2023]
MHYYRMALLMLFSLGLAGCSLGPIASNRDAMASPMASEIHTQIRARLLQQHHEWQGVPYRLGGSDKRGVDCSAFTQLALRQQLGIAIPRTTQQQAVVGRRVTTEAWLPGDLLFYRSRFKVRHVGIYIGQGEFLHASTSRGVMISRIDNPYWRASFWQARRLIQ